MWSSCCLLRLTEQETVFNNIPAQWGMHSNRIVLWKTLCVVFPVILHVDKTLATSRCFMFFLLQSCWLLLTGNDVLQEHIYVAGLLFRVADIMICCVSVLGLLFLLTKTSLPSSFYVYWKKLRKDSGSVLPNNICKTLKEKTIGLRIFLLLFFFPQYV